MRGLPPGEIELAANAREGGQETQRDPPVVACAGARRGGQRWRLGAGGQRWRLGAGLARPPLPVRFARLMLRILTRSTLGRQRDP